MVTLTQPKYIHDSFLIRNLIFFQNFSYIYMAVVAHYSMA